MGDKKKVWKKIVYIITIIWMIDWNKINFTKAYIPYTDQVDNGKYRCTKDALVIILNRFIEMCSL